MGLYKVFFILKIVNKIIFDFFLNRLFELPPFSISKCYAQVIFTMFLATFYANIVPLGLFFSIVSLILLYFTYKVFSIRNFHFYCL